MTDKAISPLRQRMIEDMTIHNLASKTRHDYVHRGRNFAAFVGRSSDTATFQDVRRYQLHLASIGVGVSTLNQALSTLRFFFRVTLKRYDIVEYSHFVHEPRKLAVWHRCAEPNGRSMPSAHSASYGPCWPICRATPTASPSPTAG